MNLCDENIKIALLISGHTRSIRHTAINIKRLLNVLKCDVFIHRWDSPDMVNSTWRKPENYQQDEGSIENLIQSFNPIKCLTESQIVIQEEIGRIFAASSLNQPYLGAHYMIYGMQKCLSLCRSEVEANRKSYDLIIRYRFDISCINPESIYKDISSLIKSCNTIIMPEHNWAKKCGAFFDGVMIANFKDYCTLMDFLPREFNSMCSRLNPEEKVFPELFITKIIYQHQIKISPSCSTFQLIRDQGLIEQEFKNQNTFFNNLRSSYCINSYMDQISQGFCKNELHNAWASRSNQFERMFVRILRILVGQVKNLLLKNHTK